MLDAAGARAPRRGRGRSHQASATRLRAAAGALAVLLAMPLLGLGSRASSTEGEPAALSLPAGFQEEMVFSGLTLPTAVRFAPDGRVFVTEKAGLVKVFSGLDDPTPTVFADLRTNVLSLSDSGLLGLALDPNFAANPYVYVSYAYDAPLGGTAPVYGDKCGRGFGNCPTSGRLSRLRAAGEQVTGPEEVLLREWCRQFPTHSLDDLDFGDDGALYASAGEGATAKQLDYGQLGDPSNPCGDPPVGVGGTQQPPTAEGGSLRS